MRNLSLLGIPIYTLTKNFGIGLTVKSLRDLGFVQVLSKQFDHVTDYGDVKLPRLAGDDNIPNLKNYDHFSACSDAIVDAAKKIAAEEMVFCLGGECGLILGSAAGFKQNLAGQPGLLWIDAHGDFNTPETTRSGFIGGMPLAFVCGHGPKFDPEIEELRPLIKEKSVVHVGGRDFDPLESTSMKNSQMTLYSLHDIRARGISKTATEIADAVAEKSDWIICHFDVDALDPSIVSAVNFPSPGGLNLEEVRILVEAVNRTGRLKVMNLAGYNSVLDKDKTSGRALLELVSRLSL